MKGNQWARLLAYVTGLVNQELLLQNKYLAAENRILRAQLPARLHLSDSERRPNRPAPRAFITCSFDFSVVASPYATGSKYTVSGSAGL